jgi:uncharacterized membrane protein
MKTPFEQNQLDRMRNNPDNYKWGIFYFNPGDPGIIVPKRNRWLGWTLNFANPYSYLVLLGIIVFGFLMEQIVH